MLDEATAPLLQREVICSDFNHLEEVFLGGGTKQSSPEEQNRELWGKQLRCFEAGEGFPVRGRDAQA